MISLPGNVRHEANALNDRGKSNESLEMEHMLLQLQRPADREAALEKLINEMHQPGNPNFHHWLTADELGQKFGPNPADISKVSRWLANHGFQVNSVSKSGLVIDFSGTAGQVNKAFKTEIHNLNVHGDSHIANMQNPQIPAAFANIVLGVASLNDFHPHPANKGISSAHIDPVSKGVVARATTAQGVSPNFTIDSSTQAVVPDDIHTIYNFNPVYKDNITGKGETIVVIEDTNVFSTDDWTVFRDTFGLSKYKKGSFTQIHPGGCKDPGVRIGDDGEAILDAE